MYDPRGLHDSDSTHAQVYKQRVAYVHIMHFCITAVAEL